MTRTTPRAAALSLLLLACNGGGSADNDSDGIPAGVDCDDEDPQVGVYTWYADADGDGFGDPVSPTGGCDAPAGHSGEGGDCADDDPGVFPGAAELCDDVDQDCDGAIDESPDDAGMWYEDADGDGVGVSSSTVEACALPEGYAALDGDCDDGEASVYPGATAVCGDGLDNDCDGLGDCGFALEGEMEMGDAWVRIDGTSSRALGMSIVGGEDLTGDGEPDLVIGLDDVFGFEIARIFPGPLSPELSIDDYNGALLGSNGGAASSPYSLALGDIDDDGVTDIASGDPRTSYDPGDGSTETRGAVHFALGPVSGQVDLLRDDETFSIFGGAEDEQFGAKVLVGDVSADGLVDLIVGAPTFGPQDTGRIYYVEGPIGTVSASVDDFTPSILTAEDVRDGEIGRVMDIAEDIDGDGRDDLVIGVPNLFYGAVSVLMEELPLQSHLVDSATVAVFAGVPDTGFGETVTGAGDLDGDGYGEVLVGANRTTEDHVGAGRVWILSGELLTQNTRDIPAPEQLSEAVLVGDGEEWAFGTSVEGVGDLDGDGRGEVFVGAPRYDEGRDRPGAAFLFSGPYAGTTYSSERVWQFTGDADDVGVGTGVGVIGDANGLGLPDLVIHAEGSGSTVSTRHGSLFLIPTDAL